MRISIALTVHNAARYLSPLLSSLTRQTHQPYEVVAYDDASGDATPEVLQAFAARAPFPVRLLRGDGQVGHIEGFLRAARACTGDAIAFCDGDDVWIEHKLEVCAGELDRAGAGLVLHATRVVDAELRDLDRGWPAIGQSRRVPPLGLRDLATVAPGMAMVFRRELLDVADFGARPPSRYGHGKQMHHDEWILFVAGVVGKVSLVAEPLLLYRQHAANVSGGWLNNERRLSLQPAVDDYRRAAEHTSACAAYLDRAASTNARLATRLRAGAEAYAADARNWSSRASLYASRGRAKRIRLLRELLASGAYRPRDGGGFGRRALVKDVAAGLALGARADVDAA